MKTLDELLDSYSTDEKIRAAFRDGIIQGAELNAEYNAQLHNEILRRQSAERTKTLFSKESYFTLTINELESELEKLRPREEYE